MENTNQKGDTLQTTESIRVTEMQTSKVNGFSSIEERLSWCEEYIKILLEKKDESEAMHILDGRDISDMKQRLSKLEEAN